MEDQNLKNQFKNMMEGALKDAPEFTEMWPHSGKENSRKLIIPYFRMVAATILVALSVAVFLWFNSRKMDISDVAGLNKWEYPTDKLLPNETPHIKSARLLNWQSPTSSLMKPLVIQVNETN